ncbi:tetratricopeptide repeat protein [Amycolatopsis sp. A133]|uniref:tetratricopeptide repeat protein n=1 Tax=Amycolatopsis sp. A133 TaxID=3064472 RepID=UPI0028003CE7|nr:tetratricopeptide repeat protein [Amycolatopsis sp. A133]MDQ7808408.1 tetratricopeptide repeat protein [Amycolatopsis sp. A133]
MSDETVTREDVARELTGARVRAKKGRRAATSVKALAVRANISESSLYAYFKGTTLPSAEVLERVLRALGVEGAELGRICTLRDRVDVTQRVGSTQPLGNTGARQPRELRASSRRFVGRRAELEWLERSLGRSDECPRVVVLSGMAGVGKTTLALHWSRGVAVDFPDGQLYANLRGFDRESPAEPERILEDFLRSLGVAPSALPSGREAKSSLFRTVVAARRMIVFLDNARSAGQVRPLLSGSEECLTVVTSRDRLDGLVVHDGAHQLTLDLMPQDDARRLIGRYVGDGRAQADRDAVDNLVELCGRLPLALGIVAAGAARRPAVGLRDLVDELRGAGGRLDLLGSWDAELDLRTVFNWSCAALPGEAAELFTLFGVHPGPDLEQRACGALLNRERIPRAALGSLVAANLITESGVGRYRIHDLLHEYARERVATLTAGVRDQAVSRLVEHYVRAVALAGECLERHQGSRKDRVPNSLLPPLDTYQDAMDWLEAEFLTVRSLIEQLASTSFAPQAWQMARDCNVFVRRTGRRGERLAIHRAAVTAAAYMGDKRASARSTRHLAEAMSRLGRQEEAAELLATALSTSEGEADRASVLATRLSFSRVFEAAGRYPDALEHADAALTMAEQDGDARTFADAATSAGRILGLLGRHEQSLELSLRALAEYRRRGHIEGQADVLKGIGDAEHALGRPAEAIARYRESLELDRRLGDRYWEANALNRLADVYESRGETQRALDCRSESLSLLRSLHHPDAEKVAAKLI